MTLEVLVPAQNISTWRKPINTISHIERANTDSHIEHNSHIERANTKSHIGCSNTCSHIETKNSHQLFGIFSMMKESGIDTLRKWVTKRTQHAQRGSRYYKNHIDRIFFFGKGLKWDNFDDSDSAFSLNIAVVVVIV